MYVFVEPWYAETSSSVPIFEGNNGGLRLKFGKRTAEENAVVLWLEIVRFVKLCKWGFVLRVPFNT